MIYATYKKDGKIRSGIFSQTQYSELQNTSGISELQIHPNQMSMSNAVNESKGLPVNNQRLLFG